METLVENIQNLPTHQINALVNDINVIAKKSKKKTLSSGQMFFRDYCGKIAEALQKGSAKELVHKYRLV